MPDLVAATGALRIGDVVRLPASGLRCKVGDLLGAGGQGAVHRVQQEDGDRVYALKWYGTGDAGSAEARRLRAVLARPRPSPEFLWPIAFADAPGRPGYGYVMPLATAPTSLLRNLNGRLPPRLRIGCDIGASLAAAFLRLHSAGLCYADLSASNVLIDPGTGAVQICDNDNVVVQGTPTAVLGTPYFMAPEILRGEARPSDRTDLHSLAVLLHLLVVRHHPLLGAVESQIAHPDDVSLLRLLGERPVFVFDPEDRANHPVEGVHANALVLWPMLPAFMRALFVQAFTVGLADPDQRVGEATWRAAFLRLRGLVRGCPTCGAEQFWDPADPGRPCADPACRALLPEPLRLEARHIVVLEQEAAVRRSDLMLVSARADDPVVATVLEHGGRLVLRNRTDAAWVAGDAAGETRIGPSAGVPVTVGLELETPDGTGRVVGPPPSGPGDQRPKNGIGPSE